MQAQSELELYTQPENKMPLERISVSSDAFGSAPVFDRHGKLTRYEASDSLQIAHCKAWVQMLRGRSCYYGVALSVALHESHCPLNICMQL